MMLKKQSISLSSHQEICVTNSYDFETFYIIQNHIKVFNNVPPVLPCYVNFTQDKRLMDFGHRILRFDEMYSKVSTLQLKKICQKRVGTKSRKLKEEVKGLKSKLRKKVIHRLQTFYGIPICSNGGNLKGM